MHDSRGRGTRRLLAAFLLASGWLLATAPVAAAHATLVGTVPANGEHLARPPAEITLRFSEPVSLVRSGFSLLDAQGRAAGSVVPEVIPGAGDQVRVPMPGTLGDGAFVVTWRVVSADSHPVHGAFVFSVGDARAAPVADAGAQGGTDPWVGALFWGVRLLSYVSLALLLGGAFFVAVCWPGGREDERVRRLLRWSWLVATGSAAGMFLLQGPAAAGSSPASIVDPALIGETLQTGYGVLVVARMLILVVFAVLYRRVRGRATAAVVLAGGAALAFTWSGTGHASVGATAPLTTAADVVHLVAMAVWLGGLAVLGGCVLAGGRLTTSDAIAVSERFSRTALLAVVTLAVSGAVVAAKEILGSPDLAGSRYAGLLLFKLAVFGLLLCVAALSRSVVHSRLTSSEPRNRAARKSQDDALRRLRRTVGGEVSIAAVVLGVAALLVATPPAERVSGPAPVAARSGPYLDALALPSSGDVQVWVEPATAGDNQVAINVRDERGVNRDVPEVSARLSLAARGVGPIPVPLVRTLAGQYVAERMAIPIAGDWRLEISVRTGTFDESTVDTAVPVT